jgi:tripartite-type tricarboxylate transporter receptor subunit TctC
MSRDGYGLMHNSRFAMKHALFLLAALFAATAAAQSYPSRPIHLYVPIPPGGAPDTAARVIAEQLGPRLGEAVVVENKVGSNGRIATDELAHAAPDGYTLGLIADSQVVINPHVYKMDLDTLKALTPVSTVASNQFVLAINPDLPAKTFPEFIEYARHHQPPLAYASGGNGSQHHLTMEMLKARTGIDLLHVPYRGGAPATAATVSGETAAMWAGSSNATQIKAGRLRALAVSGAKRSAAYPDLPTISEFYPGFENSIWLGIFAPAGVPEEVLERLRREIHAVLESPQTKERFNRAGGLEPFVTAPEEFSAMIRRDYDKYGAVVKKLGIKIQ